MKTMKFSLLSLLVAFSISFAQQMFNSSVENEGVDCSVTLPTSFTATSTALPDPFTKLDGNRMGSKEEWKCRRQELLKLLERTAYGAKPSKPASVTGTVSKTSISVNAGGGNFSVSVTMPSGGSAPYPLVIRYDNSGVSATNFTNNGVAVANITTSIVGGGSRNAKTGAFYAANSGSSKTGHLAAWAWGVSRIIDVIEADPDKLFDPTKIGVTGCSRDGKGAFVAGVLDQRVALTMPMESGTGGMASMRVAYNNRDQSGGTSGSQSPSAAYGEQPWLGDDFSSFQNNPNTLPIDMHEAVALVAPRGFLAVYKTASSAGQWLNVPGSHVSAVAGVEVYKALGFGGNFGWLNTGTESHCQWTSSYNSTVKDFIDIYLHRTKAPATAPLFTENNRPAMTNYMNWTTPTLSGTYSPGGTSPPSGSSSSISNISSSSNGGITLSSSSKVTEPQVCGEYQPSFCGGLAYASVPSNSTTMPSTENCLYIGDFETIQPALSSTVAINGVENTCGSDWDNCPYNDKSTAKDGGYYVYVKTGTINSYQDNGWQGIVAKAKPSCETTPILNSNHLPQTASFLYYSLKGEPLGNVKPQTAGVYIVKQGYSIKKILVR